MWLWRIHRNETFRAALESKITSKTRIVRSWLRICTGETVKLRQPANQFIESAIGVLILCDDDFSP
jgi:hypothetical protein